MPRQADTTVKPSTGRERRQSGLKRRQMKSKADPELLAWGRRIIARDGRCQWPGGCNTGDTRLDPHHLAPRSRRPDLKYDPANGQTLCRTHHEWVGDHPIEAEQMGLINSETYEAARKQ